MANIVTETIVKVNGHPVYSGSKMGANVALQNALNKATAEGRAEPTIEVTERSVDYDKNDSDSSKVTETPITL